MTDGHVLKTDVKFSHDAGPQVRAATHELHVGGGGGVVGPEAGKRATLRFDDVRAEPRYSCESRSNHLRY